jgi:hypothetical protein
LSSGKERRHWSSTNYLIYSLTYDGVQVGSTLLRFVVAILMRGGGDGDGGGRADDAAVDGAADSLASISLSPSAVTGGEEAAVSTSKTYGCSSADDDGRRTHAAPPDSEEAVAAAAVGVPWCHTLVLQVHERNNAAVAFYKRHGFRVVGLLRDYYCSGAVANYGDGVQMERVLRPRPSTTPSPTCTSATAAVRGATQSKAQKRNARRARTRAAGRVTPTV